MKSLVVYSSRTGNTEKVAHAIFNALPDPKTLSRVENAPPPEEYDFVAIGFWVDKGTADLKAQEYMKRINGQKIGIFGTLGAYPDSDHAQNVMKKIRQLVSSNEILGEFLCQGKVDPALVKMMAEKMVNDPHHAMTPEREARLKEAEKHPDDADLANAAEVFRAMIPKESACADL